MRISSRVPRNSLTPVPPDWIAEATPARTRLLLNERTPPENPAGLSADAFSAVVNADATKQRLQVLVPGVAAVEGSTTTGISGTPAAQTAGAAFDVTVRAVDDYFNRVTANNPAVTNPDAGKMRRGLSREDLFTVVHDPFMTVTARYADIVLPATTYPETEDFYRSYGSYWMQYGSAAVPPQGEARSNVAVAQALAVRMGLNDPIFAARPADIVVKMFEGATGPAARVDPRQLPTLGPVNIAHNKPQKFTTPSGKLEFYSEQLARQGLPPMPDWTPDPEEVRDAGRWPLRLLTAPGYFQAHTAYSGVAFLRKREGAPFCVLHASAVRGTFPEPPGRIA